MKPIKINNSVANSVDFICDNIKGFDLKVSTFSGSFQREIYLPRGEHAAYMETMEELSQGFVMTMSDHIKDPENDYRVRTMALDSIDYDFGEPGFGQGKLGDRVKKGEAYAYSTIVESLPDDADSLYIRFVKMDARGECVPKVVAMKPFGTSKIIKCDPSQKFVNSRGRTVLPAETEYVNEEDSDDDYLYVGPGKDNDSDENIELVRGYRLFRFIFMFPCGVALIVLAFTGALNGLEGEMTYGNSFIDSIMEFFYNGFGFAVGGFIGLNLVFRSFLISWQIFNSFMTSYGRVFIAGLLSFIITAGSIAGVVYFATEGGIFATSEEKESIQILENDIWDVIHKHVDKYGYDIWETDYPQTGKTLVFAAIADHALTEKEANEDPEKNMMWNMVFRARNSYFYTKIWASEEKYKDTVSTALERYDNLDKLISTITGHKYDAEALKEFLKKNAKKVKTELEDCGEYEAVTSEGIKIYIEEDYIYLDEDDDVPAVEGYNMEIRISDKYDIKNMIG